MIAQIFLSIGLGACLFYVFGLGRAVRTVRLSLFALVLTGLLFIWIPELANRIAHLLGIGRGADMMMYVWILMSLFLILRLHIKLRENTELMTKLAREYALDSAKE